MKARKHHRKRNWLIGIAIFVGVLIAIRLALPYAILRYANKTLATMDGYRGHVKDIDLSIYRGAYTIDSIYLHKHDSATNKETPFFAANKIDLSLEWKALFKGQLVGEIAFSEPMLRFTREKVEPNEIKKDSSDFRQLLQDFMPLKINKFEVHNGRVQYIDESSKPKVDVQISNLDMVATNLRNSYDSAGVLPATVRATGEVYEGTLDVNLKINPLAKVPTFDLTAEIENTNLVKLNDFFEAYARVDLNKGTFGLFTEVAAKDGKFKGYIKPLLKDVSVTGIEDRKDNVLKKLWEGFVGTVGQVVENLPKDQVATKIPFEGDIEDPTANVWYAIAHVLQNAFIQALQPAIDHEINLSSVNAEKIEDKKNVIEQIFSKDDKKKDKDDKKEKN